MSEHLKFLGRRQELEMGERSLKIRARGLINNLRDALDPLEEISNLRTDRILEWAVELADVGDRTKQVQERLKEIRDILGS